MAKIAEEDRQRLLESRHNIAALSDAGRLTPDETFKRALVRSRERLSVARGVLLEAVQHNLKEVGETSGARAELDESFGRSLRQYGFVRSKTSDALFNVDPDDPIDAIEATKRKTAFESVFTQTSGPLSSLGPAKLAERLDEVAKAMSHSPQISALGLHGRLERAVADLRPKLDLWVKEGGEDRDAMKDLKKARETFAREYNGHTGLVRSVLEREGSQVPSGRYILSDDPAYRARRGAGQPLDAEPGIGDVDDEAESPQG